MPGFQSGAERTGRREPRALARGRRLLAALGLILAAALALPAGLVAPAAQAQSGPVVQSVRIGGTPAATRFVLEMTNPVKPEVFTLGAPYRVEVDLPEVAWRLPPNDIGARGGLVDGFRFGLFEAGRSRLVIDGEILRILADGGLGDLLLGEQTAKRAQALAQALRLKLSLGD